MALLGKEMTLKHNYVNYYKRFQQLTRKPQAKISGLISLTIFTVAFFGMFAILPTFRTIAELNREIEDAELVNAKLVNKVKTLNQVEEVYADSIKDLEIIDGVLPKEAGFERLAWQLHWLANDKGLVLEGGSFNDFMILGAQSANSTSKDKNKTGGATEKEAIELETEITVTGSYGQIKEFVKEVARIDRLIEINELSIGSKKYRADLGKITANIKLTAFYLPNPVRSETEGVKQ